MSKKNFFIIGLTLLAIIASASLGWLNRSDNQKSTEPEGPTQIAFSKLSTLGFTGRLYVFQDHKLKQLSYGSPNETIVVQSFPFNVVSVAMYPDLQGYAYISTKDQRDRLYLHDRSGAKDRLILTADHHFSGQDEVQSTTLMGPIRFSPDGQVLLIRNGLWEGCSDILIDIATGKQLATMACDSAAWSTDGEFVTFGNGQNYDGPIQLFVGSTLFLQQLTSVDWTKVEHGNYFLDAQDQPVIANAYPAFEDNDHIILLVTPTVFPSNEGSSLYRYTISRARVDRLVHFSGRFSGGLAVQGHQAIIINDSGRILIDLTTNHFSVITSGIDVPGQAFLQFFPGHDQTLTYVSSLFAQSGAVDSSTITTLDLTGRTVDTILDEPGVFFAGWSPLTAISSNDSMLKESGVVPLTKTQTAALDKQIENPKEYFPTQEDVGDSTCGQSVNHNVLAKINQGPKNELGLSGGYRLITTPNSDNWNWLDALNFSLDPTIACGVGTYTPQAVTEQFVFWVQGCGGVGINDPKNIEQVGCFQGEDIFYQHFGLE